MIWVILAALGIPLWLCAVGILATLLRNRSLRKRHGDMLVRVRLAGKKRWIRGHAIWVSDVFVWRGSPAAWSEDVLQIIAAAPRTADSEELKKLRRLDGGPAIARLWLAGGELLDVATTAKQGEALLGPFDPKMKPIGTSDTKQTELRRTGT